MPEKVNVEVNKVIPNASTNGYQFKKDWQLLANNLEDLAKYFKVLNFKLGKYKKG